MFTWFQRIAALSIVFCVACGGEEATEAVDPPQQQTEEADEASDEPIEDEDDPFADDEAPLEGEVDVDEMDEHALEAACFAGQQAACDQLGH